MTTNRLRTETSGSEPVRAVAGSESIRAAARFSPDRDETGPGHDDGGAGAGRRDAIRSGNGAHPPTSLSAERIAALRQWIEGGGHNDPDVAGLVAKRILERGDI